MLVIFLHVDDEINEFESVLQAIKFRGLNTISPNSSIKNKSKPMAGATASMAATKMMQKAAAGLATQPALVLGSAHGASAPATPPSNMVAPAALPEPPSRVQGRVNPYHPCYQCSSLNENSAKKLCRKQPIAVLAHTETQLMRTYPAGMRIDSSNFNPIVYWCFGIQMVALNYQTEDLHVHLNHAMFEQNGRCGFVMKPSVMWDRSHMMYRRFNPYDKEFDGLHSSHLVLHVISGQWVCPNALLTSVFVEVEVVGIQADFAKQRTKVIQRNALNPIWNNEFTFHIMFRELAFLRFTVQEAATNHVLAQRVVPLKCLKPGYRHIRLRSMQNQPLPLATLFIYSRMEEESVDYNGAAMENGDAAAAAAVAAVAAKGGGASALAAAGTLAMLPRREAPEEKKAVALVPLRRRMFFLMVHGVVPDEPTILKITQESTTQEVVLQALQKAGLGLDKLHDYILVEEVARSWEKKGKDEPAAQRVLDLQERPLQAQAAWQGEGRFLLKRIGDDPSSRAWLSSIRSTAAGRRGDSDKQDQGQGLKTWDEEENFLVCVYNVSPEIPYAILKVPRTACAQDVLAQALVKARRMEDPARFVLMEELEWGGAAGGAATKQNRVLADEENVYRTQAHWETMGRFILRERDEVTPQASPWGARRHRVGHNLRTVTQNMVRKVLDTSASASGAAKEKVPVQEALSDPTVRQGAARHGSVARGGRGGSAGGAGSAAASRASSLTQRGREVHSEGETLSDDDRDGDLRSAVSNLKKMSLRKLRVWKS